MHAIAYQIEPRNTHLFWRVCSTVRRHHKHPKAISVSPPTHTSIFTHLGRSHQFEVANPQCPPTAKRVAVQVVQDGGPRRKCRSPCRGGELGSTNQIAPLVHAVDGLGQVDCCSVGLMLRRHYMCIRAKTKKQERRQKLRQISEIDTSKYKGDMT